MIKKPVDTLSNIRQWENEAGRRLPDVEKTVPSDNLGENPRYQVEQGTKTPKRTPPGERVIIRRRRQERKPIKEIRSDRQRQIE